MNSRMLRDIPLRLLQGKIVDDRINLLQACYDNTIFSGDGTKAYPTQNGSSRTGKAQEYGADVFEDGIEGHGPALSAEKRSTSCHVSCSHLHSLPTSKSSEVTYSTHENRSRPLILFLLCLVVVLAVTIGLLVYFLGHASSSSSLPAPTSVSPVITLANVKGSLTIIAGPFAMYTHNMADTSSPDYVFIRNAFLFKMDKIFSSSDFASLYNRTLIAAVNDNRGHIQLSFVIYIQPNITATEDLLDQLQELLVAGFRDSLFVIDEKTISLLAIVTGLNMGSTPPPGQCQPVLLGKCANITRYSSTTYPNLLDHKSPQEVDTAFRNIYEHLFLRSCYAYEEDFYCSVLAPECGIHGKPIPPCQKYCEDVMMACNASYDGLPQIPLSCGELPDSDDPSVCRQNPYKPGVCVPVNLELCPANMFNSTAYPNILGGLKPDASGIIITHVIQDTTNCFKYAVLYSCSLFAPPCSGKPFPYHSIPPCSSLCAAYRDRCGIFHDILSQHWPTPVNCSDFPDSPDPNVCVGYHEAREPVIRECGSKEITCGKDSCIKPSWLCDGFQDCDDNSDENNCAMCQSDEQMCSPVSSLCIHKSQGCDGVNDCYMDVDEHFCIRMDNEFDTDVLEVYNSVSSEWEEVCEEGWTPELSDLTCKQLGYKSALTAAYVRESTVKKSKISELRNGSEPDKLQSYLEKGFPKCSTGFVVKLVCWQAVCGTRPAYFKSATRVVGGDEVKPGAWPWMAALHGGSSEAFYCGATIIDPQWILTAGHCVGENTQETNYWVIKVGNTRRLAYSEHRQVRRVKDLYVHSNFSVQTVDSDIALIHLEKPLAINDFVRPICLPDHIPEVGTRCYATGWGKAVHDAPVYEPVMRQVSVDITSKEYCKLAISRPEHKVPYKLTNNMFCAGGAYAHDSCQGDSGGPLVCRKENVTDEWYQGGIVSWGVICGHPNTPGVYTNLALYVNWIRNIISNSSYPEN